MRGPGRLHRLASRIEDQNPDPSASSWPIFEEIVALEPDAAEVEELAAVAGNSRAPALQEAVGVLFVHFANNDEAKFRISVLLAFLMSLRSHGSDAALQLGLSALDIVLGRHGGRLLERPELLDLLRVLASFCGRSASYPLDSTAVDVLARCRMVDLRRAALSPEEECQLRAWLERLPEHGVAELIPQRALEYLKVLKDRAAARP